MFNRTLIVGNLAKDPELRFTPQDTAVCNLRIASNHIIKKKDGQDKEEVLFITATVWAKRAENCAKYLKKGSHVFVEGRLVTRSWEQDEQKRSVIELHVEDIQFLDRVKEGTSSEEEPGD
jgi:single-strand DNA-binding protein